jgi:hypothetical protein
VWNYVLRVCWLPEALRCGVLAIKRPSTNWMAFLGSVEPRVPAPSLAPDGGRLVEPATGAGPQHQRSLAGRSVPRPRLRLEIESDRDRRRLYTSRL